MGSRSRLASLEDSMVTAPFAERTSCYCALCISRCGAIARVEDGRFVALEPDPSHPTGKALCAKGRAAPELIYHPERLRHLIKRTRPKTDPDSGWERIGWDEALDLTAARYPGRQCGTRKERSPCSEMRRRRLCARVAPLAATGPVSIDR